MKRKVFAVISLLAMSFLAVAAAGAHELILKPSKMEAAGGEPLHVELHSVHRFIVKEEVENVERVKAGLFDEGKVAYSEIKGNEANLCIDLSVTPKKDGATIIVAEKDGEPWSVTSEGGKVGTRKEWEAKGLIVKSTNKYDKFSKVIINASKEDKNFAAVVGQRLEIVPVTNPADAKVGDYVQVKVLLHGQPASLPIWATFDGFETEHENTWAYYTESNAEGIAFIKITNPGLWFIRSVKNGEPGVPGEIDALNLRSILTIEVK